MTPEARLKSEVLTALNALPNVRMFNNPRGMAYTERGTPIVHGMINGAGDLTGWRTLPSGTAQFVSIELKTKRGVLTPDQSRWLAAVNNAGGLAFVARSVDEALRWVQAP